MAINTSVKLAFKGVNTSGWNLGDSVFRGLLLRESGLASSPISGDSSLPSIWVPPSFGFLLGLLFQLLSFQKGPDKFLLIDELFG